MPYDDTGLYVDEIDVESHIARRNIIYTVW